MARLDEMHRRDEKGETRIHHKEMRFSCDLKEGFAWQEKKALTIKRVRTIPGIVQK